MEEDESGLKDLRKADKAIAAAEESLREENAKAEAREEALERIRIEAEEQREKELELKAALEDLGRRKEQRCQERAERLKLAEGLWSRPCFVRLRSSRPPRSLPPACL